MNKLLKHFIVTLSFALMLICITALNTTEAEAKSLGKIKATKKTITVKKTTTIKWTKPPKKIKRNKVKWSTSNKKIVKITKTAKTKKSVTVKGLKKGKATITLKYKGKKVGKVKITVKAATKKTTTPTKEPATTKPGNVEKPTTEPEKLIDNDDFPTTSKTVSSTRGLTAEINSIVVTGRDEDTYVSRSEYFTIHGGSGIYDISITKNMKNVSAGCDVDEEYPGGMASRDYYISLEDFLIEKNSTGKQIEIPITIIDRNDSSKSTSIIMYVCVMKSVKVSVNIYSANGEEISDNLYGSPRFWMGKYNESFWQEDDGTYYVPIGSHTVYFDVEGVYDQFSYQVDVSKSGTISLTIPLNKISVLSNNEKYKAEEFEYWYDDNFNTVGYGNVLFLENGTYYNLYSDSAQSNVAVSVKAVIEELIVDKSVITVTADVIVEDNSEIVKENAVELTLGEEYTISETDEYQLYYFKFVAPEDGLYIWENENVWLAWNGCVDGNFENAKRPFPWGVYERYYFTAGETYYFIVESYGAEGSVVIHKGDKEILVDEKLSLSVATGESSFVRFVPQETGTYIFYTSEKGDAEEDLNLSLYDIEGNLLDDTYNSENKTEIAYELEEGKTYYIDVDFWSWYQEALDVTLNVKKVDN